MRIWVIVPTSHSSLHPVRWAVISLVVVPLVLLAATSIAAAAQAREVAQLFRNILRYTLFAEILLIVALALSGAVYERVSQARDLRLHPPGGRLVDVGGYKLHLYCTGEGNPTVIFEHGLDGSYLDWRLVQPEIARFTRACSYDRAGYGWSEPSPKPRVPGAMAEELHTLLNHAGEKGPFIIVAHSMGVFNAQMYARHYPAQVLALVLVDGSSPEEPLPFSWKAKLTLRLLEFTAPFGLPRWRKWCAGTNEAWQPLQAAVNCKAKVFRTHYQQWTAVPAAAAEIRELANSLTLPVVVISRDPSLARNSTAEQHWMELQKKLLALSPYSRQVIARGSGHGIPGQRPDVIVDIVRDLVKELPQARPQPSPRSLSPSASDGGARARREVELP